MKIANQSDNWKSIVILMFCFITLTYFVGLVPAAAPPAVPSFANVSYGKHANQVCDIYVPTQVTRVDVRSTASVEAGIAPSPEHAT